MDPEIPLIQARLTHEDDLINQRISWLVNSQSFLLTAYAITLNGLAADSGRPQAPIQRQLLELLPMAGIGCVILVAVAIAGGLFAICELRTFAATKYPKDRLFIPGGCGDCGRSLRHLRASNIRSHQIPEGSAVYHLQADHSVSRGQRPDGDTHCLPGHLARDISPLVKLFLSFA